MGLGEQVNANAALWIPWLGALCCCPSGPAREPGKRHLGNMRYADDMKARSLSIKPDPDFSRMEKVLRRQGEPDRVPFYEYTSSIVPHVMLRLGRISQEECEAYRNFSRPLPGQLQRDYMYLLGYDYVRVDPKGFMFSQGERAVGKTKEGDLRYVQGKQHRIASWADFDEYPWPDMTAVDYTPFEEHHAQSPAGMKAIACYSGILENTMWILGYEGISFLLYDDPELVKAVFDAVGSRIVECLGTCASYEAVGAVQFGDDMGFKTQTLLSPEVYRQYLFPWHRKVVEAVHARGKPIILHSCGNLGEIMEDIIDCGWDAKNSFEDVIEPVWEIKRKYGDRIALLGGFDMDKISRNSEAEVRAHTRSLVAKCAPGGGWALGTGNSAASYVPADNLLTMLEEGYRVGQYG